MPLELESLRKALSALERALRASRQVAQGSSEEVAEAVRGGVIQAFEVAYEQSWKFIQRWIRENRSPEEAEAARSRKDLFRVAAKVGLIADPLPWFAFGEARNLTSHTYEAEHAEEALRAAEAFLPEGLALLQALEARND